jgi:hypothetical protein
MAENAALLRDFYVRLLDTLRGERFSIVPGSALSTCLWRCAILAA